MNDNIPMPNLVGDERKVIVNGRAYYTMTANKCPICSGDDHYMYLKQKHTGGDCTIECVNCDYYITLKPEMVNWNLRKLR